jgi:membrane protease YdiL (CAAX protease family)
VQLQTRQIISAIVAVCSIYAIWSAAAAGLLTKPRDLGGAVAFDTAMRVVLPLVLLFGLHKIGLIHPSQYWTVSPLMSRTKREVVALMVIATIGLLTYVITFNIVLVASNGALESSVAEGAAARFHTDWPAFLLTLYVAAAASFSEEVFFRGIPRVIFLPVRAAWLRNGLYLLSSSAFFGLIHLPYGPASAIAAVYFGVVAGLIFIWTRNLWYPMVGHFVTNTVADWWQYKKLGMLIL